MDTTERGGEGRGVEVGDVLRVEAHAETLLGDAGDVGVPVEDHVLTKALPLDGHFEVLVEEGKEAGQGHGMARGIFDLDEVLDHEENIIESTWASSSPAHHRVALKVVGLEARHEALSNVKDGCDVLLLNFKQVLALEEPVDLDVPGNRPELVAVKGVDEVGHPFAFFGREKLDPGGQFLGERGSLGL